MKKKNIMLLIALLLAAPILLTACSKTDEGAEIIPEIENNKEDDSKDTGEIVDSLEATGQITIGNSAELTGDWVPYWTNNTADYDIYNFISGMDTVSMTPEGEYLMNESVLQNYKVEENEDGSKIYTFIIKDDLKYADGSEITAIDYITSVMLWSSKVVEDTGGKADMGYYLDGYKEFNDGSSKEFTGVNLINDNEFSLTIAAEELPYFYELAAVSTLPVKLSFWTDEDTEIKDDGNGAYFSDNFTLENFEERLNKARKEVEEFPSTGSYKLISYDKSERAAVLEVNENFPGDYSGEKPKIKTITYKKVATEAALNELEAGGVDLLPQIASKDNINSGLDLVEEGRIDYISYPRAGYGKIVFQADFGPTEDIEVRQAIAHLIDRNEFAKELTGGFATVANGPYAEPMWFYQETKSELNEALDKYPYSLETAQELLEEAGWTFDADGNKYKEGIRYKKMGDGELMPLIIEWASAEGNLFSDLLAGKLGENEDIKEAGIEIKQTVMPFDELLLYMYRDVSQDEKYGTPTFGMYNLATKYTPRFDLSHTYTTDTEIIKEGYNNNYIIDEELEAAAKAMINLNPEDRDEYKENFVKFAIRWNQLLPDIPLYSNIYHDFYSSKLKNYYANDLMLISDSLLYAHVEEN